MRRSARRKALGVSLLEVVFAMGLAASMLIVLGEVIDTATRAQHQITVQDRTSATSHAILTEVRGVAFGSRRVYSDDAEGRGYFAALDTSALPPLAGTRLPVVSSEGRLEPDAAGVPETGNALLLAVEDAPQDVEVSGSRYRVDCVRFVAFYVTRVARKVLHGAPDQLDLVRFTSVPHADRASIDAILDPDDRATVVQALVAANVDRAWVSGQPVANAFFALNADGTIEAAPVVSPVISSAVDWPLDQLLDRKRISVARNAPTSRVPQFAELVVGAPDFPSGFEVKVVGPSGGRQVLIRLALQSSGPDGTDLNTQATKVLTVRDL